MNRRHLLLFLFVLLGIGTNAQDFSNRGRNFWVAYTPHIDNTQSVMGLYITCNVASNVTVQVGTASTTYPIPAGGLKRIFIGTSTPSTPMDFSSAAVYNAQSDGIKSGAGIHITSNNDVVVYSHIIKSARSGATLVLPTTVLGKEYIVPSYRNAATNGGGNSGFGAITVVAVEDQTTIEVTPSITAGIHTAGVPFTVTIPNAGDVYQLQGIQNGDLSGSKVKSISLSTGTCKPIAVFSSTTWSAFDCGINSSGGDNLYQQLFPTKSWGKKFITAPLVGGNNSDIIRVFVQTPSTIVTKTENGVTTTLTGLNSVGNYYEVLTNNPIVIETSQPSSVVQYIKSQTCNGNTLSDPEMIVINPVEQTLNEIAFFSAHQSYVPPGQTAVTQHYVNIIIPTSRANTLKIDGNAPTGNFVAIPNSNYSYLKENLTVSSASNPVHTLKADTGFIAIVYGFGNVESYGYNAGTNVKDLYQFISIQNQYSSVNFPASCKASPFYFSMTFPYQPTQIKWQFGGLFPDTTLNPPNFDSSWNVNGKQLYRYKLPNTYTINTPGTYPIKVFAQNPSSDGCGNEQEIIYDLQVFERPSANFSFTTNGCVSDSVRFTDLTNTGGRPIAKWNWNFDDGGTAAIKNPAHLFSTSGTFNVKLSIITDVGCISDTIPKAVNLSQSPTAKFGATGPFCIGNTITFTDTSSTPSGTIVKWYWDFGDGSPIVPATTNVAQTHTYATSGQFTVKLQVETASGCKSALTPKIITINPSPNASYTFGSGCLPNAAISFTNTTTISGGTTANFAYAWVFSDGGTSTQTSPTHTFTSGGPFTATLIATSPAGCVDDTIQTVNTIYSQPVASISVNKRVVCLGEANTFTNASTISGSTITEHLWNFGDGTMATTTSAAKTYSLPGIYFIKYIAKSALECVSDTARDTITVLPPPTASFTATGFKCAGNTINLTSTSTSNIAGVTPSQFTWYVNNASVGTGATFAWQPTATGNYDVKLVIATPAGCTDDTVMNIQVFPKPVVDFSLPNVCLPAGTAAFTNATTVADGSALSYSWDFGDGGTSTQTNPTYTYAAIGPYQVKLIATSANGCADQKIKQLTTIYAQPQAQFTNVAEVCLGGAVTFTDASTAPASTVTQWLWTFDDGTTSTQQNPSKTFATAGPHTVTLKVTSAIGCESSIKTGSVTVNPLPTAHFNLSSPSCVTRDLTLTDNSVANAGAITKWDWNIGEGTPFTKNTGAPFTHNYAAAGNYAVKLTVTTDKGCTNNFEDTARIHFLPVPGFLMPENCLTDPFSQFTDTSHIGDGSESAFTYRWYFDDPNATVANPNTATGPNPRHKYTIARSYDVRLTVTSNYGCADSVTQRFFINGAIPQSAFTINGATHCSSDSVRITNNSGVDVGNIVKLEIFWDAADVSTKVVDNNPTAGKIYAFKYPNLFSPATKQYTIKVIAYSGDNCLSQITQNVTVSANPDLKLGNITPVCADAGGFRINSATVTNSAIVPGNFSFSGTGVTNAGLFTPATAGAGNHVLTVTYTGNNGCSATAQQNALVYAVPVVNAGPDRFVLQGGVDSLLATATGVGLNYSWNPATWLSSASVLRPKVTPQDDQPYTLSVTSSEGCKASDAVFVKVLKAPTIPNVFTPNGDGHNDKWEIQYLETYPGATIEVYNRYGQIVFKSIGYSKAWDGTYNGKQLPSGTYYYIINPKNGRKQIAGFVDLIR